MRGDNFVYFIQDTVTNNVKIGFSRNPLTRLKTLQRSTANPLKLAGVIHGTSKAETGLHAVYAAFKVQGEWFSKDVLSYFDTRPGLSLQSINCEMLRRKPPKLKKKDIPVYFKENLRWLFKDRVLSKEARKLGLRVSLVHDWVSGARAPSAKNMVNTKIICNYFKISVNDLFFKDLSKEASSSRE